MKENDSEWNFKWEKSGVSSHSKKIGNQKIRKMSAMVPLNVREVSEGKKIF